MNIKAVWRRVVFGIMLWKLFHIVVVSLTIGILPLHGLDSVNHGSANQRGDTVRRHLTKGDAMAYLRISKEGYHRGDPICAFYPLWPFLISGFCWLTRGDYFLVGVILANVLSIAAVLLFYRLTVITRSVETATSAVFLMLAFPGALFFSFIYTEALFFVLVTLFFSVIFHRKYFWAAIIGFSLPLTRAIGIFCILPLLWHSCFERSSWPARLACLGPLCGYATYFGLMYAFTGNPFEGFEAQKYYANQPSISNILNLPGLLQAFLSVGDLHGRTDSAIDRAFFLILVCCLPAIWRMDKGYFFYALGSGVVPAMSNWFLSYNRFLMMCFPVFIVFGERLKERKNRALLWYTVCVMGSIQVWFLVRHVSFGWAG